MRRWSFVIGAVLIVIGVLAILQVGLTALGIAFRIGWIFWPLVLIGIGAWLVVGVSRRSGRSDVPREQASVPLEGARDAAITVRHGAGRLTIGSGAVSGDQLLSGTFGGGLEASRRTENGRLVVDMRVRDRDVSHYIFGPWRHGWAGTLDWDFALSSAIPLSLRLETGASEARLSLGDLQVRELFLKTGASSTTIDLPRRAGHTQGDGGIRCGGRQDPGPAGCRRLHRGAQHPRRGSRGHDEIPRVRGEATGPRISTRRRTRRKSSSRRVWGRWRSTSEIAVAARGRRTAAPVIA